MDEFVLPPLLGPDDPPPAVVVNEAGAAPVVLACDHAGNAVPERLADLGLTEDDLADHIAWDAGAAEVARLLARRLDAPAVLAGYSRLVIDCNRAPGHETSIAKASHGVVVPGNLGLSTAEIAQRQAEIFRPYHAAIDRLLARPRPDRLAPAFITIHSFAPVLDGIARPWHVGVLWADDPRIARPLMDRLDGALLGPDGGPLVVGDNAPYSGKLEYGYTTKVHAAGAGLASVLIEIRADLIADPDGVDRMAEIVGGALEDVLADPAIFAPGRG
jgi:predicted N-formylglutamate amidohydrolase